MGMVTFYNSYNQEITIGKFSNKCKRDMKYVVEEVLEVLERIYNNYSPRTAYVSPQLICAELHGNLQLIKEAFNIIEGMGVLRKTNIISINKESPNARLLRTRRLYIIDRKPVDEDIVNDPH